MQWKTRLVGISVGLCLGGLGQHQLANAQTLPIPIADDTLPVNTTVTLQGTTFKIEGGTADRTNLFHSFQNFSLPVGATAWFNNASGVENIITRVTGGNISNIDGLIRANGTANLFLLNPNGIVFGPYARLDIGGSFLGSTADRVLFNDGSFFSATDTATTPPLLTINVPIGLQFGTQPGGIRVEGAGHGLPSVRDSNTDTKRIPIEQRTTGLQVEEGETLALVGGQLDLVGGNLTARAGRIELGSLGENSQLSLTPIVQGWTLGYEGVSNFGEIRFSNAASIDTSGAGAGGIQVRGNSLSLKDGSSIFAITLGAGTGEAVNIHTSEAVEIDGLSSNRFNSGIWALVQSPESAAIGSDVIVNTGRLGVRNGGRIATTIFGSGMAGDLTVNATESVELSDPSQNNSSNPISSALLAEVRQNRSGGGGNLTINTGRLLVENGALVSVSTKGSGDAGNLTVNATEIEVRGFVTSESPSGLFARVEEGASGDGGNLTVNTENLTVSNGGQISTGTNGGGQGGDLEIQAHEINLVTNEDPMKIVEIQSAIRATVEGKGTGNGGDIDIITDHLYVRGGSSISTTTQSRGMAGDISIRAQEVEVIGATQFRNSDGDESLRPSQIAAQVNSTASGQGGRIDIDTDRLLVSNGARISAITQGSGDAGSIKIKAQDVTITGFASYLTLGIQPSSVTAQVEATENNRNPIGNGGRITVDVDRLLLENGGRISAITQGSGNAGNIEIKAQDVTITGFASYLTLGIQPSSVTAQVEATRHNMNPIGNGDEVRVTADRLLLENGGRISASTQGFGDAGSVNINAREIELRGVASLDRFPDEPSRIEALAESTRNNLIPTGDAGRVNIRANFLRMTDGAEILVRSQGSGTTGNLEINSSHLQLRNRSEINAQADLDIPIYGPIIPNQGGNITIKTGTLTALENSDINANAPQGRGGNITINAQGIFGTEVREFNTLGSDITATGEIENGTIEIQTPDVDPSTGLLQLPETPIDAASLIGQNPCAKGVDNEFVDRGRGGLPPTPGEALRGEESSVNLVDFPPNWESRVIEDDRNPEVVTEPPVRQLVEAQGWFVDAQDRVILTANPPTVTPNGSGEPSSCRLP